MVETRSGLSPEASTQPGKSYKDAVEETPSASVTARAGGARGAGRAPRGLRLGRLALDAAQLYTLRGLAHGALAVPLLFGCAQTARAAFGAAADPPEAQHCALFQLYASGLASSMAAAFALEELARRRMLHTFTADTLKLGLIMHGASWLALMLYYPATLTLVGALVEGTAAAATAALPASHLLASDQDRRRVARDLRVSRRCWSVHSPVSFF